jgi:hypothetical protein
MTGRARQRRTDEFPSANFRYKDEHSRLPHREVLAGTPYVMHWGWSPRRPLLGDWDDFDVVRFRHLYGSIRAKDEEIGAIELQEFEVAVYARRREFLESLDDDSLDSASLAMAICKIFTEREFARIIAVGTIVYFNSAWMRPDHAIGAVWARLANQVINRMRRCAVIVAKAFPLEYQPDRALREDQEERSKALQLARRHRQQAMYRHYERVLGLRRSTRRGLEEGWMWRFHPIIIEADA